MIAWDKKLSSVLDGLTDRSPWARRLAVFSARWLLLLMISGVIFFVPPGAYLFVFGATGLGYASAFLISAAVRRPRPYEVRPDLVHLKPWMYTSSFPSGHATASVALSIGVFLVGVPLWLSITIAVGAVVVSVSRVVVGVHYLSDILAGALLGLLANLFLLYIAGTL